MQVFDDTHPSYSPEQHDGERLKELLEEQGITVMVFATDYIKKSRPVAYALLRKRKFSYDELAVMCYLFGIHPTFFGYAEGYIPRRTVLPAAENNVAVFLSLALYAEQEKKKKKENRRDFIATYFAHLTDYAGRSQRQLRVYQYLGKERRDYVSHVLEQYPAYYNSLEQRMHGLPQLHYDRFVALPVQKSLHARSLEKTLTLALERMLPEMVRHIAYCLAAFPQRYAFYAIPTPARLHSFTIVDRRFAISEYDRIDRNNKVGHDLLFIDQAFAQVENDHMKNLIQVYHNDLNKMAKEKGQAPPRKVGWEKFMEVLLARQVQLNAQRQEIEAALGEKQPLPESEFSPAYFKELSDLKVQLRQLQKRIEEWNEKVEQGKSGYQLIKGCHHHVVP